MAYQQSTSYNNKNQHHSLQLSPEGPGEHAFVDGNRVYRISCSDDNRAGLADPDHTQGRTGEKQTALTPAGLSLEANHLDIGLR
jgi:hypothetical protein